MHPSLSRRALGILSFFLVVSLAATADLHFNFNSGLQNSRLQLAAAGNAAAPSQYVAVEGNHLVDANGNIFLMKGVILTGFSGAEPVLSGFILKGYQQWEIDDGASVLAAARRWGANTIRFNVGQPSLDPQNPIITGAERTRYLSQLNDAVMQALQNGFIAYVTLNDENGDGEPNANFAGSPREATLRAWQALLAEPFANAQYRHAVVFDIYNEPTCVDWATWQNGGTSTCFGTTYQVIGENALIKYIRDAGAKNVLVAGGIHWATELDPAYQLTDPLGQLAYSIHTRADKADLTASAAGDNRVFDQQFGAMQHQGGVPVIDSAMLGMTSDSTGCNKEIPVNGAFLFNYLKKNSIGILGWSFDVDGSIVTGGTDASGVKLYAPTTYNNFTCGPIGKGNGTLLQDWFLSDNPAPAASTLSYSTAKGVAIAIPLGGLATGKITFTIAAQPSHGTVALSGNTATYQPARDYNGYDTFSYIVTDGNGNESQPGEIVLAVGNTSHSTPPTSTVSVVVAGYTPAPATLLVTGSGDTSNTQSPDLSSNSGGGSGSGGIAASDLSNGYGSNGYGKDGGTQAGGLVRCNGAADCSLCAGVDLLQKIINFAIFLAFAIATPLFAYAGFRLMTSGGETEGRNKAKEVFKTAGIGLIFVLCGYIIVDTIIHTVIINNNSQYFGPGQSWNSVGTCPARPLMYEKVQTWLGGLFSVQPIITPSVGVGACSSGTLTSNGTCQQSDGTYAVPYGYSCAPDTTFNPKTGGCIDQTTGYETSNPVPSYIYGGGITSGGRGTAQCADTNSNCSISAIQQAASEQSINLTSAQANAMSCIAVTENGGNPVGCSVTTACGTFQINQGNWNAYAPAGCAGLDNRNNGSCNLKTTIIMVNKLGYQPWTGGNPPWNPNARTCVQNYDPGANI